VPFTWVGKWRASSLGGADADRQKKKKKKEKAAIRYPSRVPLHPSAVFVHLLPEIKPPPAVDPTVFNHAFDLAGGGGRPVGLACVTVLKLLPAQPHPDDGPRASKFNLACGYAPAWSAAV